MFGLWMRTLNIHHLGHYPLLSRCCVIVPLLPVSHFSAGVCQEAARHGQALVEPDGGPARLRPRGRVLVPARRGGECPSLTNHPARAPSTSCVSFMGLTYTMNVDPSAREKNRTKTE